MPYTENPHKTFVATASIAKGKLVALTEGGVSVCNATGTAIGVADGAAASGEPVSVRLFNAGGTVEVLAGGTFAAGEAVAPNGSGAAVKQAGEAKAFGIALAAGSNGAIVEILPL